MAAPLKSRAGTIYQANSWCYAKRRRALRFGAETLRNVHPNRAVVKD
jgi:hypothetical protein